MRMRIVFGAALATVVAMIASSAFALTDLEKLGGLIYRDTNLSINYNQSCMTCHHPWAGFADPVNRHDPVDYPVSQGSLPGLYGGRNAPTSAYAGFSPLFAWNEALDSYIGGMFWDGRATGEELGDPLAEQARGPFQNPVEMGLTPDEVVARVSVSNYSHLFESEYPGTDWNDISTTYNNIARAIAAFERSNAVTRFDSRFDHFWAACTANGIDVSEIGKSVDPMDTPQGILSSGELKGLALFNSKAGCAACHLSTDYSPGQIPPLFTNHAYDNIGIPTNFRVYDLAGGQPPDLGLGGRLGQQDQYGKFKIPTLRNAAKSAPYGHNGYFSTLEQIVNFYNRRDVEGSDWFGIPPDVDININTDDMGDLGLTSNEEKWIVSFLHALSDQNK